MPFGNNADYDDDPSSPVNPRANPWRWELSDVARDVLEQADTRASSEHERDAVAAYTALAGPGPAEMEACGLAEVRSGLAAWREPGVSSETQTYRGEMAAGGALGGAAVEPEPTAVVAAERPRGSGDGSAHLAREELTVTSVAVSGEIDSAATDADAGAGALPRKPRATAKREDPWQQKRRRALAEVAAYAEQPLPNLMKPEKWLCECTVAVSLRSSAGRQGESVTLTAAAGESSAVAVRRWAKNSAAGPLKQAVRDPSAHSCCCCCCGCCGCCGCCCCCAYCCCCGVGWPCCGYPC